MASKGDQMGADVLAKHMATKVHTWRGKYPRLFAITTTSVQNVDPSNFSITNTWMWPDVVEFAPAVSSVSDFTFTVRTGKKSEVLKYSADCRAPLLCDLQRYFAAETGSRKFVAVKFSRAAVRVEVVLEVGTWYIAVFEPSGRRLSMYPFKEITGVRQLKDDPSAFLIYTGCRPRLYATPERSEVMRLLLGYLTRLGMTSVISDIGVTTGEYRSERLALGNDGSPKIGEFEVLKVTSKWPTPRTRKLIVTETSLVERDSSTYSVVGARPLTTIFSLTRHWDEPQKVTIDYKDGSSRMYLTSLRDALIGSLLDGCRNAGNIHVCLHAEPVRAGDRLMPLSSEDDPEVTALYLAHIHRNVKGSATTSGPYNSSLVRACAEFNANVSPCGVQWGTKKGLIAPILPEVVSQLNGVIGLEDFPSSILVTLLASLTRLVSCKEGVKLFSTLSDSVAVIQAAMAHEDEGVCFWGFELLHRVVHNPRRPAESDDDLEAAAKKIFLVLDMRVAIIQALDVHASGSGGGNSGVAGNEGTLVMLAITGLLDAVLVSKVDTTPQEVGDHLMQLVASRYFSLLSLFRCQCAGIVESSALLMRAIVDQADVGTTRAMQAAALSSGVWLRHFYNAMFAPSVDQRYVSRYLVELWSTGNGTAREVLRHMLPTGIILYLEMPKLKDSEAAHLEAVETGMDAAALKATGSGSSSLKLPADKNGSAQRLRNRLEGAEKASHNRVKRRLVALDEHAAGAKKGKRKHDPAAVANMAAAAAAAVAAQAAMTKAKIEEGKEENYPIFFFQLLQDHVLPDLIWNQQTRAEFRASVEAELREIEREIELGGGGGGATPGSGITNKAGGGAGVSTAASPSGGAGVTAAAPGASGEGSGSTAASPVSSMSASATITGGSGVSLRVAWNFAEFEIEYPSLVQELRVGDYYLRLFLEAGDASVSTLREPGRFFDALYRRVLRENAPNLKCMCLRGMARVYEKHHKVIGPFEDTDYMVYLLSTSMHAEVRDRLLLLLLSLSVNSINCEKMINPDCLELLVDLLTTAHTTDVEQRAMPVMKGGASLLLLTNAPVGYSDHSGGGGGSTSGTATGEGATAAADAEAAATNSNPKESLKVWHYRAAKADLSPGEKPEKGPYSLQDMARLGEMKKIIASTLVWAQGMREWVRLDSLRALLWFTCSDGVNALTPTARGEVCVDLLRRLVNLRPSVDAEGAPVRPVPRAKRVLCGPRTLPHIAQALLAGSPKLVDLIALLLLDLVKHNPKAIVKFYMTGIFFFVLGYSGSNWKPIAELLAGTHLLQSFHSDAASLGTESTLTKRSILGALVPESMICVLENRGPVAFADTFLSNVDTPEVIWKYSMRGHLLDMVTQHLGDLPGRLAANPCTLYDYCPIPPVKYEELENELWCSNFYLANLCDESRFPEWPIGDPVGLLRAVLDAWRVEITKTSESTGSPDEAYVVLGLAKGADDKEIRKAYRKLAIKFHPDKNPAGRDTFEKIQKAYDLLTAARGPSASAGPDQVAITLMVKTQCILFARHAKLLKQYKYAGYPLVLESMQGIPAEERLVGDRATFLEACTRLVYLTCLSTPKNAEELIRENGCEVLLYILSRLIPAICVHPPLSSDDLTIRITENVLHTLSGLSTMKDARERMLSSPNFANHVAVILTQVQCAKVMQHALEMVARLAVVPQFQDSLIGAGVLYRLIPLLFRYDATLEGTTDASVASVAMPTAYAKQGGPPSTSTAIVMSGMGGGTNAGRPPATSNVGPESVSNEQKSANQQAKLAVRALGRLGGYLDGDLASPKHGGSRRALAALLTPPLAKRLSRANPEPLLRTLNGHEETAVVVWTAPMRKELLGFISAQLDVVNKTGRANMAASHTFIYGPTREELRVAGIYIKFYVNDPSMPLEDAHLLVLQLLQHVAHSRVGGALPVAPPTPGTPEDSGEDGPPYNYETMPGDLARKHLRLALRALHLVLVNVPGTESVISKEGKPFVPALVHLLEKDDPASGEGGDGSELMMQHAGPGASTNKAAAGSGASAGCGGARSTPAPPSANLQELILTAIAAFAPYETCAATLASLHLVPVLIRLLPRNSGSFGPILRTLFAHAAVVTEMARIAAIIDLLTTFAGGVASGPAPGKAGGPRAGHNAPVTIPKSARASAAALLSLMSSDAINGPPVFMQLTQLVPETLAISIKESVSGATSAGTGTTGVSLTGVGMGAAGAGGGTGGMGDVVTAFDSDHETPELIWNAVCRHELRCSLGELVNGITNLRKKAQSVGAAGGYDGCGWSMPASFRVRYSAHEGELRVGGVYIRVFLKEPTYPLRDPKAFLEALMRRFMQEAEQLCGMTSEDADKVRSTMLQASEAAKAEEASGGVAAKTREGVSGDNALVVRGEDVLTQITHAIVCLLRVRVTLGDHAATLGYVSKTVQCLSASSGKAARYNLGIQCTRLLQVFASSKACVAAAGKANVVSVILRSMAPIHRDAAFTLEALKMMLETDSSDGHVLVEQAIRSDGINFLVNLLEKEKLDHLVDPSAAKVHAVGIIKILETDALHGPSAAAMLESLHKTSWEKYRHQKHDLFLSRNDTRDYFLADIATSGPQFMLKNSAEWTGHESSQLPPAHAPPMARVPSAESMVPPTMHVEGMTGPPPAPDYIAPAQLRFGAFQAPAPAMSSPVAHAPAPAPVASAVDPFASVFAAPQARAPASAPRPQPQVSPELDFFATPAAASSVPIVLGGPAPAAFDPFAAPIPARAPAPAPAPKPAGDDPFADLLG